MFFLYMLVGVAVAGLTLGFTYDEWIEWDDPALIFIAGIAIWLLWPIFFFSLIGMWVKRLWQNRAGESKEMEHDV